ncbi:unnamed protein product [Echinostoma caproni]|uniref:2Fe-2S ferredoxin-type domain-containing protein n=1 Tax=Echinostoma caproni TaxID=27848 RepID=A0A183A2Q6_9TREM|nr:unnamed protein product [Echinostoma caproni]
MVEVRMGLTGSAVGTFRVLSGLDELERGKSDSFVDCVTGCGVCRVNSLCQSLWLSAPDCHAIPVMEDIRSYINRCRLSVTSLGNEPGA